MEYGFLKVASANPKIKVASCFENAEKIIFLIKEAVKEKVSLLVLPELCVTGYTAGDLFLQNTLIAKSEEAVKQIIKEVPNSIIVCIGCPVSFRGKLFNCSLVISNRTILGIVPKKNIPNYQEFYELRWFTPALERAQKIIFAGQKTLLGYKMIFCCNDFPLFRLAVELCEDAWVTLPPSSFHSANGATVIANLSASDELAGKSTYRDTLLGGLTGRQASGYIYASTGEGESTSDLVFTGYNMIWEAGTRIAQCENCADKLLISDLDLEAIDHERRLRNTFTCAEDPDYIYVNFDLKISESTLNRFYPRFPFVPDDDSLRSERCSHITNLQALGLKRRLEHIGCKKAIIGLSGGLDSTLALLVTLKAFKMLNLDNLGIICVTMPCFGTTERTKGNAERLAEAYGCTLRIIDITSAVLQHFKDINHDENLQDVTYENSQARERTQILMDIANQEKGIVIGTGDLSEMALGWATYNGDHMSMYGVNSGVPKTLVKVLVKEISKQEKPKIAKILDDILDTPISPELIPGKQETENLVGPYELHDFFIYHALRWGLGPKKIYYLSKYVFNGIYTDEVIYKWLKSFYYRFFSQQYKRSCMPDGPKVGSVAFSPRGDLRMPSDACSRDWINELEEIH